MASQHCSTNPSETDHSCNEAPDSFIIKEEKVDFDHELQSFGISPTREEYLFNTCTIKEEKIQSDGAQCEKSGQLDEKLIECDETFFPKTEIVDLGIDIKREIPWPDGETNNNCNTLFNCKLDIQQDIAPGGHALDETKPSASVKATYVNSTSDHDTEAHRLSSFNANESFSCSVCSRTFMRKKNLKNHIMTHTYEKSFSCSICYKTFIRKNNCKRHMVIHRKTGGFPCSICNRLFTQKGSLEKHNNRYHEREKDFICSACGRLFTCKDNLKKHQLIHNKEKSYTCSECGVSFSQKWYLRDHIKHIHVDKKRIVCLACGRSFTRKSDLKRHSMLHRNEKPFTCQICYKSFSREYLLKEHTIRNRCKKK